MKIVITCIDGSVQVMTVINGANVNECLEKWADVNQDKYESHREMSDDAIPSDREFREAWADTTPEPVIDICMEKARGIHLSRIRAKRNAELAKLDIDATKAQDIGDDVELAQVRARKQELRDFPEIIAPALQAAETIEELKLIVLT
mgnify:CR=1 FL=1